MPRLIIPEYAKSAARKGLRIRANLPPTKRFGLSNEQANKLKIYSGVRRANQLINSKSISLNDAKRIAAFYNRFKNRTTPRVEGAILLWGGRTFGKRAINYVKQYQK